MITIKLSEKHVNNGESRPAIVYLVADECGANSGVLIIDALVFSRRMGQSI